MSDNQEEAAAKASNDNADEASGDQPLPAADYVVGYGKPPKEAQFKKGVSGNPTGRPKGVGRISPRSSVLCSLNRLL